MDGSSAYAEVQPDPELNLTGDWTIEGWFRDDDPNGFNHDNRTILSKGDPNIPGTDVPYFLQVGRNNLIAGLRTNGQNYLLTFDLNYLGLKPRDWHHVAVTFRASQNVLNLWLDGQHVTYVVVPSHSSLGNTQPLDIGRKGPVTGQYWKGAIDDVRIWNVIRTGDQIAAAYRQELTGLQLGLVGNWKFDEGRGTLAVDSAGTPQNAMLIGEASWLTNIPQR